MKNKFVKLALAIGVTAGIVFGVASPAMAINTQVRNYGSLPVSVVWCDGRTGTIAHTYGKFYPGCVRLIQIHRGQCVWIGQAWKTICANRVTYNYEPTLSLTEVRRDR